MAAEPGKMQAPAGTNGFAPVEAEVLRVRTLRGAWRWLLVGAAALTIFLCVNQQFVLRFFVGFTPLNTEYYYALVLVVLPFVFVIFPGHARARLDRVAWYDAALFALAVAASLVLLVNIRKAAELGWEFGGAPAHLVWTGYVMWALLMEGLRRTGGWGLMLSVLPFTLYPLVADSAWLGPLKGTPEIANPAGGYYTDRFNGTYIGYVGGQRPQYVIIVRVNEPHIGGFGGSGAAQPIFGDIAHALIDNFGVVPKN